MAKRKIIIVIIIILLLPSSLCGCWDYKEISDLTFISGFALDYDKKEEQLLLTIELATPKISSEGIEMSSLIFQETGVQCFDVIRKIIPKVGKKINWSHAKVAILGASIFENENVLRDFLDYLNRTAETREDIWLLVSNENTAAEIFTDTQTELQPIKSYIIDESLRSEKSIPIFEGVPAWEFSNELTSAGSSATLPTVQFGDVQENKTPLINGEAIIKDTRIVGVLQGDEIKYKMFVTGDYKGGIYTLDEIINDMPVKLSVELDKAHTSVMSEIIGQEINMTINIEVNATVVEMDNDIDITKETNRKQLVDLMETQLERETQDFIKKVQEEYNSDIFGFGDTLKRQHHKQWEEIKNNWQDMFATVTPNVKFDIQLLGSSVTAKQRKVTADQS